MYSTRMKPNHFVWFIFYHVLFYFIRVYVCVCVYLWKIVVDNIQLNLYVFSLDYVINFVWKILPRPSTSWKLLIWIIISNVCLVRARRQSWKSSCANILLISTNELPDNDSLHVQNSSIDAAAKASGLFENSFHLYQQFLSHHKMTYHTKYKFFCSTDPKWDKKKTTTTTKLTYKWMFMSFDQFPIGEIYVAIRCSLSYCVSVQYYYSI